MNSKKGWLKANLSLIDKECEISWSSSSSSDEDKIKSPQTKRKWINLTNLNPSITSDTQSEFICIDEASQPSTSNSGSFRESPILGKCNELSPILGKTVNLSPIIGHKPTKRLNMCKKQLKPTTMIEVSPSPDLFSPQLHPITITSVSPSKSEYEIESICSQEAKSEAIVSNTTGDYDDEYYFMVPTRKTRRYKKGGFASQAEKAFAMQKSDANIWKHELYLSNLSSHHVPCLEPQLIKAMQIVQVVMEFGRTLVLCNDLNLDCKAMVLINDEFIDLNKVLVGNIFDLFPSYVVKSFNYENTVIDFYLNVSKLHFR